MDAKSIKISKSFSVSRCRSSFPRVLSALHILFVCLSSVLHIHTYYYIVCVHDLERYCPSRCAHNIMTEELIIIIIIEGKEVVEPNALYQPERETLHSRMLYVYVMYLYIKIYTHTRA